MADYTQNTTFATKDALSTGDPEKIILGADFDGEFSEIAARSADKEDTTNKGASSGYAQLDSGTLLPVAIIPAATESAIGSLELATQAEAEALSSNAKYITPHTLNDVLVDNASCLKDLQGLTDPGADRLLMWDESADAIVFLSLDTDAGLAFDLTNIKVDLNDLATYSGTVAATDFIAIVDATDSSSNKVLFSIFEGDLNAANMINALTMTAGVGLSYSSGAGGYDENSTMFVDPSDMAALKVTDVNQAEDGFVMSNNGVATVMAWDEAGVPILTQSTIQTFALTDANTLQILTGTTERIWTIPTNAAVAFEVGTIIICKNLSATQDIVIKADTGVGLRSIFHVSGTADSDHILPGGSAVLIKLLTDTWSLAGDIETS